MHLLENHYALSSPPFGFECPQQIWTLWKWPNLILRNLRRRCQWQTVDVAVADWKTFACSLVSSTGESLQWLPNDIFTKLEQSLLLSSSSAAVFKESSQKKRVSPEDLFLFLLRGLGKGVPHGMPICWSLPRSSVFCTPMWSVDHPSRREEKSKVW